MIKIEINQQDGKKIEEAKLKKIVERTLGAVGVKNAAVSIAVIGDEEMKKMNNFYRGKNKTTDVLSFTYESYKSGFKKPLFGEIVICYPQAVRQAKQQKHGVVEEIKMLLVHGALHLAGYDHEKSLKEAGIMEDLQNKMVKLLNS